MVISNAKSPARHISRVGLTMLVIISAWNSSTEAVVAMKTDLAPRTVVKKNVCNKFV